MARHVSIIESQLTEGKWLSARELAVAMDQFLATRPPQKEKQGKGKTFGPRGAVDQFRSKTETGHAREHVANRQAHVRHMLRSPQKRLNVGFVAKRVANPFCITPMGP